MHGLMMDRPLLTTEILKHAMANYRKTEIVTRTVEGPIHRYTIEDSYRRICQLANVLVAEGVKKGDRIGVIGWNTYRQFELYYAVGGLGAVLHTINPRLGPQNAAYVINHAEDEWLFYDMTFAPLVDAIAPNLPNVKKRMLLTDADHGGTRPDGVGLYEELIADAPTDFDWPDFDENTAAAMCYTSGTTGNPKGVLYSHRAIVLQTFATCLPSGLDLSEGDAILPVVPMFHVNAWNTPYSCLMAGAKQVFPGPRLDGESLYELLEDEEVNYSAGVPTVWLGLLQYMEKAGKTLNHMKKGLSGGAALPEAIIRGFAKHGVEIQQGWGMTEMTPVGAVNTLPPHMRDWSLDETMPHRLKAGRALPFVDMRIVDPEGNVLPRDGKSDGNLQVRGPWVIKDYYRAEKPTLTDDGWFDTGDVATLDQDGFMEITDRAKDVIKTGGEWVSSIEIENAALSHPEIANAAVIGVSHPKWQERPLLIVVKADGASVDDTAVKEFLKDKLDKIAWPDAVEFVDDLPIGATGKVLKTELRKSFKGYALPA
ncbi:MAG: long-chain fatty acid--CoA ligase [Pseudomonadota bacterium]